MSIACATVMLAVLILSIHLCSPGPQPPLEVTRVVTATIGVTNTPEPTATALPTPVAPAAGDGGLHH